MDTLVVGNQVHRIAEQVKAGKIVVLPAVESGMDEASVVMQGLLNYIIADMNKFSCLVDESEYMMKDTKQAFKHKKLKPWEY